MCGVLYSSNQTTQSALTGVVNFGNTVLQRNCNAYMSGGNAITRGMGEYNIFSNITFEGTAAGTVTISLYKDGVAIPGATATVTVAGDTYYQVCIPAAIYNTCCCEETITAQVSGSAVNVTNASLLIVY